MSDEYVIPGLCGLVYSLSVATDATAYAVTVVPGSPPQIRVHTVDPALKGTSVTLTMSATATPVQDTAS